MQLKQFFLLLLCKELQGAKGYFENKQLISVVGEYFNFPAESLFLMIRVQYKKGYIEQLSKGRYYLTAKAGELIDGIDRDRKKILKYGYLPEEKVLGAGRKRRRGGRRSGSGRKAYRDGVSRIQVSLSVEPETINRFREKYGKGWCRAVEDLMLRQMEGEEYNNN